MVAAVVSNPPTTNTIFDEIDTKRDGFITRSEFVGKVSVNAEDPNAQTPNELFDEIDTNHDGVITRSDFNGLVGISASTRSPVSSVRAVRVPCSPSSTVRAIQVEPVSPTMKYRGTLTSEDIKRIVERHDLVEKEKQQKEEEERRKVLKAEINWSVENRLKNVENRLQGERSEWQKALQAFHSSQVVQFDNIVAGRMGQALALINNFSSVVDARFKELEIERTKREEMSTQLLLGLDSYKQNISRAVDTHLQWRSKNEVSSKLVADRIHEELTAIRGELDVLHRQSHGHMEHQHSHIEGFVEKHQALEEKQKGLEDKQKALEEKHKARDEMHSGRHDDIISALENHNYLHEEAVTKFARAEELGRFATHEDIRQVEEFVREFAVPTDAHRNMEERLHTLTLQMDEKMEAIVQCCTPLDCYQNMEERLQSFDLQMRRFETIMESYAPLEVYQNMEERLQSLSLQVDQKLETVLRTCALLEDHQRMEEQLQSFTIQSNQKLEAVLDACVPIEAHRAMEERIQGSVVDIVRNLDDRLQFLAPLDGHLKLEESMRNLEMDLSNFRSVHGDSCRDSRELHTQMFMKSDEHTHRHNELRGVVEAAHNALSLDVEKFQNLSLDHSSRLAKLESRLDLEISNWNAKLTDCGASLKSECQENRKLLSEESTTRTRVFEELKVKLNQHGVAHADLAASHQSLASSHGQLSVSHMEHQKIHIENRSQLESRFEAECEARLLESKAVEEKRDAEIATLRVTLQRLEESVPADRTKFEKRCAAIESLIQEHPGMWESRFHAIEPRIDTAVFELSSLRGEVTTGLTNLRQKIEDAESALQRALQNTQQQAVGEAHKAQQHLSNSLKEETRLRVVALHEMSQKMENDISALTRKCDTLKFDLAQEYKTNCSQLDRTASERYTAWTTSIAQQINNLASSTQTTVEKMQQEVRQKTEELRECLADERNNHLKTAEEDRIAFKKAHDDHMRCLEVERDTRLRQTTEMRADLIKAVTKEREDRIMGISEHCSEVSRVVREWQSFKNSGGLSSRLSICNTPTGSSSENYINAFFGKTK